MKKIAFINQRYGLEVNGGSEYYTRLMAEHLVEKYDVHVLTTKAVDYMTWSNYYNCDEEIINGVTVKRFEVEHTRNQNEFNSINAKMLTSRAHSERDELRWVEEQGPYVPQLINYIKENKDEYDVFVFVTYLYYTTSMGIAEVADKAILIPTAHDEPYIYFDIFKKVFCTPKAIIFLTDEEREFVHKMFDNKEVLNDTMAVGIDVPQNVDGERFKRERNLNDYIIYVGRIDEGKGCHWLFQYFQEYKKRNKNELQLVLMGKNVINIPKHSDIVSLGFVSEEDKYDGIAGAKALVLPSKYESLSISALESLSVGTPVIMNGECEVLKGHCVKSDAGLYYKNYFEFEGCINYMIENSDAWKQMKTNGVRYVDNYYRWDVVVEKFSMVIDSI